MIQIMNLTRHRTPLQVMQHVQNHTVTMLPFEIRAHIYQASDLYTVSADDSEGGRRVLSPYVSLDPPTRPDDKHRRTSWKETTPLTLTLTPTLALALAYILPLPLTLILTKTPILTPTPTPTPTPNPNPNRNRRPIPPGTRAWSVACSCPVRIATTASSSR